LADFDGIRSSPALVTALFGVPRSAISVAVSMLCWGPMTTPWYTVTASSPPMVFQTTNGTGRLLRSGGASRLRTTTT
jgi:hypothetical protein